MKISEICHALGAQVAVPGDGERDVTKATAGDLLSFVMGNAPEGAAWITIQAHLNAAAVAVLKDLPLVIIAAGRKAPDDLVERCKKENICLAAVKTTIFQTCAVLAQLGLEE